MEVKMVRLLALTTKIIQKIWRGTLIYEIYIIFILGCDMNIYDSQMRAPTSKDKLWHCVINKPSVSSCYLETRSY
jgi:hypothetical protein